MSERSVPYGPLPWVLARLPTDEWAVIACSSSEDRGTVASRTVATHSIVGRWILRLSPAKRSEHFSTLEEISVRSLREGLDPALEVEVPWPWLSERLQEVVSSIEASGAKRVLVDISAMPKSIFLPLIKFVLLSTVFECVIATYTLPGKYPSRRLHRDVLPAAPIPGYLGRYVETSTDVSQAIVGCGFDTQGISTILGETSPKRLTLLVPFPAVPPLSTHLWASVSELRESHQGADIQPVSSVDVEGVLRTLSRVASEEGVIDLVPYGPKPVSLAMGLFAIACERVAGRSVSVTYAQPEDYAVPYSTGTRVGSDGSTSLGYVLRKE
ncbi:hypothetical protein SAMN05421879_1316 [Ornithinimicrobium cerasi]|uniref:Uncharacterized protein n=1 Tax=Ornithinimicrobium cerasi TaxID=2248773 RepID=A0A285VWH2_9MICO|nr:hypothetical protein SAMN05421879_1316 [Ornithinimicrobium cerasi]